VNPIVTPIDPQLGGLRRLRHSETVRSAVGIAAPQGTIVAYTPPNGACVARAPFPPPLGDPLSFQRSAFDVEISSIYRETRP
jgi:hypothetical protein